MKKLVSLFALSGLILALSQCTPKVHTAAKEEIKVVTSMDKEYVATHFKAAQIEEGKTLYTNNCGKCHKLFAPEKMSVQKWNHEVTAMLPKTRLTTEEGLKVRAYVIANAQ